MKMNEVVTFIDWFGEKKSAKIVGVFSDKFEEVKFSGKNILYWSKKGKDYRMVKNKDMESVYLEMKTSRGKTEYILLKDDLFAK